MAITVLTDAFISINGVTLSDHARSVTLDDAREQVDITAFGATNKVFTKGLGDATMSVEFYQDFAAGEVHATLQPLISGTTPFTVLVKGSSGTTTATNPAYTMSALLFNYGMLDGSVGEASTMTCTFQNASQSGITYAVA